MTGGRSTGEIFGIVRSGVVTDAGEALRRLDVEAKDRLMKFMFIVVVGMKV